MENDGLLRLKINEGILEGFSVKGNEKTKEYVILREMRMKPGEPFNVNDARRSVQRINNLGYFEDVNVKLNPGTEPNSVILETSVIEQRTGTFSIGAGYSDTEGMVGLVELGDRNFLGRGDNAKILWEFGGDADEYKNYEVSYSHPWADSKGSTVGATFYDRVTEYDDYDTGGHRRSTYDKQRKGLDIYYARPMTEYSTNYLTLRTRDDSYDGHVGGRVDYSKPAGAPGMSDYHNDFMTKYPNYIEDNFGRTNSVSLSHVTDTRDNVFNAMEGHRASMTLELAGGPLGGDFDFQKFTLEDRRYYRVGRAHVIALRGMVGYGMGRMPESGQFSIGGTETLRGFEDEQFQGKKMYLVNAEYRFPIAKKLQGVVFADTGNAWDGIIDDDNSMSEINIGYGVGVRFQSPLGPIRLDFGKGDGGGFKTHFSFAGQF
jgi:outer membrane protein insertion porin family